ncbi:hypothetical protein DICSQDRAFT_98495 [Dichomitus squalens LYAD-421 SS1]|uniref:uncharacterized protein n=1 Tax=Dichomitus squalens (strain LYAD-421) TaxID=732165 RepID=UPI00044155AD|nr:uncharacterized protein DICSQDRAFT_98495 [Dichomitus squalens LYAD-421 SS1]EJF65032.1 hypothetical protein DICSQDRAFT_98495 [Dichomitus squalens LYAD-421 SS1]
MPSDPPSPTTKPLPHPHAHTLSTQRPTPLRAQTTPATQSSAPRAALTPAQAIAQAWMRESAEAQAQWRMADVRAKEQYMNPVRWNTGRPEKKKRNGAKM